MFESRSDAERYALISVVVMAYAKCSRRSARYLFILSFMDSYNIAVAGTGYVGLSIATLLAQHNHVTAVDVIPEKVDLINRRLSPIRDEYI